MAKVLFLLLSFSVLGMAKTAPTFSGELMGGGRVTLKDSLKHNRALLLSFWATWCQPCMQELKEVVTHLKSDPKLPLDILTVNVDTSETKTDVKPTLKMY